MKLVHCTSASFGVAIWCISLHVLAQPAITRQPINRSVSLGATITNQVNATGGASLTYQWHFNQARLANATNRTLVLADIVAANAGNYFAVIANDSGSVTSRVAVLEVDSTFTKITRGPVVEDAASSIGATWADYDDDGYLDLFVTSGATRNGGRNFLYHNERDGTFRRIVEGGMVNTVGDWRGAAWGDYNNDGHIDVYVAASDAYGPKPFNQLYRNTGNGTFLAVSRETAGGLVGPDGGSEGCAWMDYDRDGNLDLIVVRYGNDRLYRGNGDGTFASITSGPVVTSGNDNYSAVWSDYDNDGWFDLFVAAYDGRPDALYRNQPGGAGNRVFVPAIAGAITRDVAKSQGSAWADYDNDGFPDLLVANGENLPNFLYRNQGDGTFAKVTTGPLVTATGLHPTCAWGDYDNDGFVDIVLGSRLGQDELLFRNNGDGTFTSVRSGSIANDGGDSTGVAWADYDNDGFLDLFVANLGGDSGPQPNFLYRNNGNANGWIKLRLIGTVSNRSAIGTKVRIKARIGGKDTWQLREITNNDGVSANSLIAHFGLGTAAKAELIHVEWPSGAMTKLRDVAAKQFLSIVEPPRLTGVTRNNGTAKVALRGGIGFSYVLEASTDLTTWLPLRTNTATGLAIEFEDAGAAKHERRFYRARQLEP